MNDLLQHSFVSVIGNNNCDIIKDILYFKNFKNNGIIFSDYDYNYKKKIPYFVEAFVNSKYYLPIEIWLMIDDLLHYTYKQYKTYDTNIINDLVKDYKTSSYLVLDNKTLLNKEICYNHRHLKILLILGIHNIKDIQPKLRNNLNYIFIRKCDLPNNSKYIYEPIDYEIINNTIIDYDYLVINCFTYKIFYYKKQLSPILYKET